MRVRLPKTEKGKRWTLRVVDKAPVVDGEECWGLCCYSERQIIVSKETEEHGLARETLLHEALHKIMPFLSEEAVEHTAHELDRILDLAERRDILEL